MRRTAADKVIALLLSAVLFVSCGTVAAFADNSPEEQSASKKLLVFGDSTSYGYGLSDCDVSNNGFNVRNNDLTTWTMEDAAGKGRISDSSLPWQLKKHIAEKEYEGDLSEVYLTSMCFSGMRTDELRALLDNDFFEKKKQEELEKTADGEGNIGFTTDHITRYADSLGKGGALIDGRPVETIADAQAYTRMKIQDADVIVLDVCTNNFGSYPALRMGGYLSPDNFGSARYYYREDLDDIIGMNDTVRELVKDMRRRLIQDLGVIQEGSVMDEFVKTTTYSYACCLVNYSADVEMIRSINPDAKIISVGVYNSLERIKLKVNGIMIDFNIAGNILINSMDAYIRALDKSSRYIYFADTTKDIETLVDKMETADSMDEYLSDPDGKYMMDRICARFIDSFLSDHGDLTEEQTRRLQQLLFDSVRYNTVDMEQIFSIMANISGFKENVRSYIDGTADTLPEPDMTYVHFQERMILGGGVGQHPSRNGSLRKSERVNEAYDKDKTAYQEITEELRRVAELYEELMAVIDTIDTEQLMKRLDVVFDFMITYGPALYELPEYEKLIDSMQEVLEDLSYDTAALEARVDALKWKIAVLTADYIEPDLKASVSFPDGNARITVTWDADEEAAGYEFKVDGESAEFQETGEGFIYEHNDVEIGEEYLYEVTPYTMYSGQKLYGKTVRKAVTPKVKLKKTVITSLKAGKRSFKVRWKKVSGASGYQVSYKPGKKTEIKTVTGSGKTSLKVSKLKKSKKYIVKVRAWTEVNGKKYCGAWSKAKKVKVK